MLKLYNINIPNERGGDKLDANYVHNVRQCGERARKQDGLEDESTLSLPTSPISTEVSQL